MGMKNSSTRSLLTAFKILLLTILLSNEVLFAAPLCESAHAAVNKVTPLTPAASTDVPPALPARIRARPPEASVIASLRDNRNPHEILAQIEQSDWGRIANYSEILIYLTHLIHTYKIVYKPVSVSENIPAYSHEINYYAERRAEIISGWLKMLADPLFIKQIQVESDFIKNLLPTRPSPEQLKQRFMEIHAGQLGDKKILGVWKVNYPRQITTVDKDFWAFTSMKKNTVDYEADPMDTQSPIKHIFRMFAVPRVLDNFFETVYAGYKGRIRDEIIKLAKKSDEILPVERQTYGLLYLEGQPDAFGSVRIFDGTPRRTDDFVREARRNTPPELPLEVLFRLRQVPYNFAKTLAEIRKNNPYRPIIEIGKLSIDSSDPKLQSRGMIALEYFFLNFLASRAPDALYVVHVVTDAHYALYRRRYGFKIEESIPIPGTDKVEHILTLSANDFLTALKKRTASP